MQDFIDSKGTRILIPSSSGELLEKSQSFKGYPGETFFAVGAVQNHEGATEMVSQNGTTHIGGRIDFALGEQVAVNKFSVFNQDDPHYNHPKYAALREFLDDPKNASRCPTQVDVRRQENYGKGLHLLSAGGFLFAAHDFGNGPETRLLLLQRNGGGAAGQYTDGNGMVDCENADIMEMLEEYTPVLEEDNTPGEITVLAIVPSGLVRSSAMHGKHPVVYPQMSIADAERIKSGQADAIRADLGRKNLAHNLDLKFEGIHLEFLNPDELGLQTGSIITMLTEHRYSLRGGYVGIEAENHTVFWRRFGLMRPRPGKLITADGEGLKRPTGFFTAEEAAKLPMLSSTHAVVSEIIKNGCWPQFGRRPGLYNKADLAGPIWEPPIEQLRLIM